MLVNAWQSRSNQEDYTVNQNGQPFDLVAADFIKIEVLAAGRMIDSSSDNVNFSGSTLSIKWGALPTGAGMQTATIIGYTATDELGKVLFGPGADTSIELFMNVV